MQHQAAETHAQVIVSGAGARGYGYPWLIAGTTDIRAEILIQEGRGVVPLKQLCVG